MRTPSLVQRTARSVVLVVAVAVLLLDVLVFGVVSAALHDNLDEALGLRLALAVARADEVGDDQVLVDQLAALGIPVEVVRPDGARVTASPAVVRGRPGEAVLLSVEAGERVARGTVLDDGREVTVFASRRGLDEALTTLAVVLGLGSLAAVLGAWLVGRRAARATLEPLSAMVAAARRTAGGVTGERLRPDDPETELGQLAQEYDDMLDQLEDALAEAREAEELSGRFLADAAHQLRTPMATIRAGVELLVIDPDPEQRDTHLTNLIRETSRATRVLQSLMTLARLDRGRPPHREPTDLVALCREEVERAESLAPGLDVRLVAPSGSVVVPADGGEVVEALANLLDNARRHAASAIELRVEVDGDVASVRVGDDGPGVAPAAREQVFERFASLDGRGGSGLGLPIARAVARSHGGDLVVDDDGFLLTLPVR